MAGINKVILVGRLGKDPERKEIRSSGKTFCSFSMATSKKISGEEKTTWHNVTVWNEHTAKYLCDFAVRGSMVYVEGEIENRTYEKDGVKHYATDIVVSAFNGTAQILTDGKGRDEGKSNGRSSSSSEYEKQSTGGQRSQAERELDDEIPF